MWVSIFPVHISKMFPILGEHEPVADLLNCHLNNILSTAQRYKKCSSFCTVLHIVPMAFFIYIIISKTRPQKVAKNTQI